MAVDDKDIWLMKNLPDIGEVIDNTYEIQSVLGTGGFGAVYLARQINIDRDVALKLLVASGPKFEEMVKRFRREVMAIRNLTHPNTIRVYDFRDNPEGLLYYTMEALKGETLKDAVRNGGPVSPRRLKKVMRQVLKSLSEAHSYNIIHRDLKPANIMLVEMHGETDFVKVLDFGIAKMLQDAEDEDNAAEQLTSAGILVGTLRYMAPEQITGEPLGPQTDLYALGLICVEMLTGQSVFAGTGRWDVLQQQISEAPVDIPDPVLQTPLGAVIKRCLEKQSANRYSTADEVLKELDAIEDRALSSQALYESDGGDGYRPVNSSNSANTVPLEPTFPEEAEFEGAKTTVMEVPKAVASNRTNGAGANPGFGSAQALGAQSDVQRARVDQRQTADIEPPRDNTAEIRADRTDHTDQFAEPSTSSSGPNKALIGGVAVLFVIVLAVGGVLVMQNMGEETAEDPGGQHQEVVAQNDPLEDDPIGDEQALAETDRDEEEADEDLDVHEVRIEVTNVRAMVFVDGEFQGPTPFDLRMEGEEVALRLEARGHENLETTVDRSSPEVLEFELESEEEEVDTTARAELGGSQGSDSDSQQGGATTSRQEDEARRQREAERRAERRRAEEERQAREAREARQGSDDWVDLGGGTTTTPSDTSRSSSDDWVDLGGGSSSSDDDDDDEPADIPLF